MFTVQCSITNYPPTSRKHALKLQTSQVLHVKNKNHKNQLGSLKKKNNTLILPPKKNQKNPFSILALCATVIAYYQLHNNPPLKKKIIISINAKKKFSSRKLKFDKS